jgi:hypothetical protein
LPCFLLIDTLQFLCHTKTGSTDAANVHTPLLNGPL